VDAPNLRDDFYCSVLAYSPTCHTIAVGLGSTLYAWLEKQGVHLLNAGSPNGSWLTSIAFSSTQGCRCILAFCRSDGTLALMPMYDRPLPRFEVQQPCPIACVSWRPTVSLRQSRNHVTPGLLVKIEDLVVGDESGNVYYYSVEWPEAWEVDRNGWSGVMTLLAHISIHSQQICGLAWSYDGTLLATGGNDNLCCLFSASRILQSQSDDLDTEESFTSASSVRRVQSTVDRGHVKIISTGAEKHRWIHGAAVKAIAFCPWRDSLVATGGGSNDKCIHFFHTTSGACLATISVAAQVTSLIRSTTRREIVATFGYAQPEHPYRIAVFSWPKCKQVTAIPWEGKHRALYAISYPGGPNEGHNGHEGASQMSRTAQEGCIVVAASDESVKFHEVWSADRKATVGGKGLMAVVTFLRVWRVLIKRGSSFDEFCTKAKLAFISRAELMSIHWLEITNPED
jgi:meiosis-specific APC/C activator protein AMA1